MIHFTDIQLLRTLVFVVLFCTSGAAAVAQKDLKQIDRIHHVYTNNTDNYLPLEKQNGLTKNKVRGLGYGGTDILLTIEGDTSPVKLSVDEAKSFIVNTGGEPLREYAIYKLNVNKKKRQAFLGRAGMTGVKNGDMAGVIIVRKMEDDIFTLTIEDALERGEYFIVEKSSTLTNNLDVFAFSIE